MTTPLNDLLPSWLVYLRAQRKSVHTLKNYEVGVRLFFEWCAAQGKPVVLDRATVGAFIAHLLDAGRSAPTAVARHSALRAFSKWLLEEGEIERDEIRDLSAPKLDEVPVEPYSEDELRRLIKACAGKDFLARRDEAVVRLLMATGLRASEALALTVDDVNLENYTAVVRRGKGGKGRIVGFEAQTALALDRYLRIRRTHGKADSTDALWLGANGQGFAYSALWKALKSRAEAAGLKGFHVHRLRHTFASRWLEKSGSELGLMAAAGWARIDMTLRYTKAHQQQRAAEEARRLNLGDL